MTSTEDHNTLLRQVSNAFLKANDRWRFARAYVNFRAGSTGVEPAPSKFRLSQAQAATIKRRVDKLVQDNHS